MLKKSLIIILFLLLVLPVSAKFRQNGTRVNQIKESSHKLPRPSYKPTPTPSPSPSISSSEDSEDSDEDQLTLKNIL